jgi:hypothetical protein
MGKLLSILDLFRKGSAVTEPAVWKNRGGITLALTALILSGCKVATGFGYDLPISEADAASIASGVAVLVGLLTTYGTSDKVGLPARQLPPDAGNQDAPEGQASTPESRADSVYVN